MSAFALAARASPAAPRFSSENDPTLPLDATSACFTTPTSGRDWIVSVWYGAGTRCRPGRRPGRRARSQPPSRGRGRPAALHRVRRGPMRAPVGRRREHHVLVVQAVAAVDPGHDDLVRGPGTGLRSVRDVDARCVGEVVPRTGDAVHLEAALNRIEDPGVDDLEQAIWGAERRAAVARRGHVDAVLLQLLVPAEPEHVDRPVAGGADRAAAGAAQHPELCRTPIPECWPPGPSTSCRRRSWTSRPAGRVRQTPRSGRRDSSRSTGRRCRNAGSRRRCRPRPAPCRRTPHRSCWGPTRAASRRSSCRSPRRSRCPCARRRFPQRP